MKGMYEATEGLFTATAAAFRRALHDSSHGEVPIVKPCEDERTLWKVCNFGRDMRLDWLLIQSCLIDSKLFATTNRCERVRGHT